LKKLEDVAKKAIYEGEFELKPNYCSRFVRQCANIAYEKRFDNVFGISAKETCKRFIDYELVVEELQPGDIVFKTKGAGYYGHVGIYVGNSLVAENSSTKRGRIRGALGFRTLKEFGKIDIIGRLENCKLDFFDLYFETLDNKIEEMPVILNCAWCPCRKIAEILKLQIELVDNRVKIGEVLIDYKVKIIDNLSYLPVRILARNLNLKVFVDTESKKVLLKT
jgi:hypothetical protein